MMRKCILQPELERRMRGNVLVRCGEGSGETDTRKVHGALVLLHIRRLIRSRAGGKDEEWLSTQMQKQHTDSSAYVRLDYAMICRLSSNDVSRRDV
jgi:hypothetical protein